MSEHVMENKLGHEWAHVSPHDSTKSLDVYLVPEGAQPEAVWFPSRTWLTPRVTTWSLHTREHRATLGFAQKSSYGLS
jgi:hypothetical protein